MAHQGLALSNQGLNPSDITRLPRIADTFAIHATKQGSRYLVFIVISAIKAHL